MYDLGNLSDQLRDLNTRPAKPDLAKFKDVNSLIKWLYVMNPGRDVGPVVKQLYELREDLKNYENER